MFLPKVTVKGRIAKGQGFTVIPFFGKHQHGTKFRSQYILHEAIGAPKRGDGSFVACVKEDGALATVGQLPRTVPVIGVGQVSVWPCSRVQRRKVVQLLRKSMCLVGQRGGRRGCKCKEEEVHASLYKI